LHHNNQEVYSLAPANYRKRIIDVLGKSSNDKLVPIEEDTDIVSIKGFVLKPEFARKTRGEQFFFVNNRFFRDNYFIIPFLLKKKNFFFSKSNLFK
jgi:DNA mismatch repair protein MutL